MKFHDVEMITWTPLAAEWDIWQAAAHCSPATRELRAYQLRLIARDFPSPATITTGELAEWMAGHPAWTAETMRSYRCTFRAFYSWAVKAGRLAANPAEMLPPVRVTPKPPRPAPDDAWRAALATAGDDRVRLMIILGARLGLRRGEIAKVRREDLERDLVGWSLRVAGKGDKTRLVPVPAEVALLIQGCRAGWIFPSPDPDRAGQPLTPAYVGKLVRRALGGPWTTHTLRHRYASAAYAAERDLLAVQALLGHARPETTRGYVAVPDGAMRRAAMAA